jgi:CBS domain-containing protein
MLLVKEYMTENVVTISPNDTLMHARNTMLRYGIGRLVVVEDGLVKGIITLTDIMYSVSLPELYYKPLIDILVRDVMTPNPVTVKEETSLKEACQIMLKYNIGGLPVVNDEGVLVGIFTRTDALRAYAENAGDIYTVGQAMDIDPPRVSPYSSLRKIIEAMETKPYMKTLVLDGESLMGIITKKDIAFVQIPPKMLDKPFVKRDSVLPKGKTGGVRFYIVPVAIDIMTPNPITTMPDDDLGRAAEVMLENRIGGLPVIEGGERLVGLVTKHHIIEKLSSMNI